MVSKKIAQALAGSSVIRAMFNEGKKWQHVMVLRTYMISVLKSGNSGTGVGQPLDQRDRE